MALTIFNTLRGDKEEFAPLSPGKVRIYVCGVTVYDSAHLGHCRFLLTFDVIYRYLLFSGFDVTYVRNFTDVDDKIIKRANEEQVDCTVITDRYIAEFQNDSEALGLLKPTLEPRATQHIGEIVEIIRQLETKGLAYPVDGDVFYTVSGFAGYGKLSRKKIDELAAGARVEVDERKRSPLDFALWKSSKPGEPAWESPWGPGRPGWHIECSAMSTKYLGQPFDIHGGGLENQFPHHECEIAQCEAGTGTPFVKYWLHNNMITINGTKMGKSLNNFVSLKEIFSGKIADPERAKNVSLSRAYPPDVVRFLILQSHYRAPADFSDEALEAALKGHTRLRECVQSVRGATASARDGEVEPRISEAVEQARAKFTEAMDDDFNTAGALSALFDLVRTANTAVTDGATRGSLDAINDVFTTLGGTVLGVIREHYDAQAGGANDLLSGAMELLIQLRADARKNKDFATSDKIRDALAAKGLALEDRPDVTVWRPAGP